ncbi:MAG TPA: hypothetical protein DCO93_01080 [Clostridiales bacterium]|nr:hypothetical protein [Clostridiales bacterium]
MITLSHRKRGVADLKFIKSENKSVPEICAVYKRKNLLKDGYKKTAKTNLFLAEMCLEADNEALSACEEKLTECE